MIKLSILAMIVCLLAVTKVMAADQVRRIVIYDGVATEVGAPAEASKDLWVTMKDLKRATKFVVKPQGVCRDQLCFPLPKARKAEFISKKGLFNLSEFARLVKQPVAMDDKHRVWHFGPRPDAQNAHLESLDAPDFALPDAQGKSHSLTDYRGKKVLLLTWASW
jgi:hypothetical protein